MQDRIRAIGQYVHQIIQEADAFSLELVKAEKDAAEKDRVSEAVGALRKKEAELSQVVSDLEEKKAALDREIDAIRAKHFA